MQVIISTRGMTVSRTYKDELTRKLAKLEPMLPALVATRAILTREKHRRTAALTLVARFDPEDHTTERGTRVDFNGRRPVENPTLFAGTLKRFLEQ